MKKLIVVSVLSILGLTSVNSYANCAFSAVKNAPYLPDIESSQSEDLTNLKITVEAYLDLGAQRLNDCGKFSDSFHHNIAVTRLEQTAEHYNALVRHHNQMLVSAK